MTKFGTLLKNLHANMACLAQDWQNPVVWMQQLLTAANVGPNAVSHVGRRPTVSQRF